MLIRIPVVYQGKPLMPTRLTKAKRLVKDGKAVWKLNKRLRLNFIELLVPPSSYNFQDVNMGFDPGSCFDGVTVSSPRYNHINLELIHNKGVKDRLESRKDNRQVRRGNLRNRPSRFDNRNKEKLVPTIRGMLEFRKFNVNELLNLFPVSKVIYERVAYRGKNQQFFTQVHLGQNAFLKFLRSRVKSVLTVKGYITKRKRIKLFGKDLKTGNKGERSFEAHCLDSFTLSTLTMGKKFKFPRIAITRFITKNWVNRRELFKNNKNLQSKKKEYFKYVKQGTPGSVYMKGYWVTRELCKGSKVKFKYVKPGWVIYFTKRGNPSVGYTQKYPKSFKEFEMFNNGRVKCFKKAQPQNYGGTIVKGKSRSPNPLGSSKKARFKNGNQVGYLNRYVSFEGVY